MFLCKIKCEKTQKICSCIKNINDQAIHLLEKYAAPILLLAIRLWMANIFFKSGLTKIDNLDITIALFEYEYALPIISPTLAAYLAIAFELGCSVLLALGLFARLAALGMLVMAIVIQFLVFDNIEHFYWMFLLSTIVIFGAGKISLCNLFSKFCKAEIKN